MMRTWRRRAALAILAVIIVGLGAAGFVLWRGVPFPTPSGPHLVGRASFPLTDPSRPEIFSDDPSDVRTLMVVVHYPAADGTDAARAPYADRQLAAGISVAFSTPQFVAGSMNSHALDRPACREQEVAIRWLSFRLVSASRRCFTRPRSRTWPATGSLS